MALSVRFVLVNYNSGEWLQRAVQSVLDSTQAALSVVDNASSDESFTATQIAINDARVAFIANSTNRGFAAANNQVLSQLREDVAVLMNPDCLLNANTLPPILAALEADPRIGAASCRILNADGSNQATSRRHFPTPLSALARILQLHRLAQSPAWAKDFNFGGTARADEPLQYVPAISGAFMVIRTRTLKTVGLLDEAYFMHCEDLDWCKRCELAGIPIAFVAQSSVIHAKGISSKSRPIGVLWNLHTGMLRFFDTYYRSQYGTVIRGITKFGIYASFCARAGLSLLKQASARVTSGVRGRR